MSYTSGNITGSSTPAADLLALVEQALTAHASWTFVEEHPTQTGVRVWRNDSNDAGVTFYAYLLAFDADSLHLTTSEGYNATTHEWSGWALVPGNTVNPQTEVNPDDTLTVTAASPNVMNETTDWILSVETNTTDFTYSIWVTRNILCLSTDASSFVFGLGVYDSITTHANDFPLGFFMFGNADPDGSGGLTRRAGLYDYGQASGDTFMSDAMAVTGSIDAHSTLEGKIPSGMHHLNGQAIGSRVRVWSPSVEPSISVSQFLGLHYDMLTFQTDAGVQPGDTIEVNGATHVLPHCINMLGLFFDTTAA